MFGHNAITGQKFFRESPEAADGKLLVTSIFATIQGEGPCAGEPALFVRLAKCQLACSFCDTYFDTGDWMTPDEVLERMMLSTGLRVLGDASGGLFDLAVITGGEPTLQPGLGELCERLMGEGLRVQIESNGLLPPRVPAGVLVVVSPKCAEGANGPTRYLRPPDPSLARADCLKFVMSGDPPSPYASVPTWALDWVDETGREVYVSPMAEYTRTPEQASRLYSDRYAAADMASRSAAEKVSFWEPGLLDLDKCRRNYEHAAQYVMRYGLRLSIQQHLFASLP